MCKVTWEEICWMNSALKDKMANFNNFTHVRMKMKSKYFRSCWDQIAVLEKQMFEFVIDSVTWELCDILVTDGGSTHTCLDGCILRIWNATEY